MGNRTSRPLPVTERMETLIHGWEAAADRRAIFLRCYLLMTRNMLAAVDGGKFGDCDWVHGLLHRFADYYFEALAPYEQNVSRFHILREPYFCPSCENARRTAPA